MTVPMPPPPEPLYRVVATPAGRKALWPAAKSIPAGWGEIVSPRDRAACLASLDESAPAVAKPTMGFGLMFFGGDEGDAAGDQYDFLLDVCARADDGPFTAIWLPERHFSRMGSLYPNPAVLHAAVAVKTKRIRLRAGSVVLPLNHPARVAEEWAVVDHLSHGRVEISFAPGWNATDFALAPGGYATRYDTLERHLAVVRSLWAGHAVEFPDGHGKPVSIRTYPTPRQKSLPVWVTAASSRTSFETAGRLGADVLTHLFDHDAAGLGEKITAYRSARANAGFDPATGRVAVALHTYLADDPADVNANAEGPYKAYMKSNKALLAQFAASRNLPIDFATLPDAQLDGVLDLMYEKFLKKRSLLGTPDECVETVESLTRVGVTEIACLLDFGPTRDAIRSRLPTLETFANRFS